jgi:hypothetical protein
MHQLFISLNPGKQTAYALNLAKSPAQPNAANLAQLRSPLDMLRAAL